LRRLTFLLLVTEIACARRRQSSPRSGGAPTGHTTRSRTTYSPRSTRSSTTTAYSRRSSAASAPQFTRTYSGSRASRRATSTVYFLPRARYVGQTRRSLSTRLSEHVRAGKNTRGAYVLARTKPGRAADRVESSHIALLNTFESGGNRNRGPDPSAYRRASRPSPVLTVLRRQFHRQRR
jgi:hypothetical protein